MSYQLKGALYDLGDHVSYGDVLYMVKARRLTNIGIVYHITSEEGEYQSHHDVPQAALDPAPTVAAGRR